MYNMLKNVLDEDNKLENITDKLSVKHQIAEDVLVSIIIDYQIWTAAEGDY